MRRVTLFQTLRVPSLFQITAIGLLALAGPAQAADQPFDVIVTADSTRVMAGEKPIGEVKKGTQLTVSQTNGDRYLIDLPNANPPQQGWIRKSDVQLILPSATGTPRLMVQLGHSSSVDSVAFSPDGKQVLTGSYDHTARLWDAASGKEIRRFEGHSNPVTSVAFSPDGKRVLTGSGDSPLDVMIDTTARLWDTASGKEIRRFDGHTIDVTSVAFSPDGKQILTGSEDYTARPAVNSS